jgi:hypothetical protein
LFSSDCKLCLFRGSSRPKLNPPSQPFHLKRGRQRKVHFSYQIKAPAKELPSVFILLQRARGHGLVLPLIPYHRGDEASRTPGPDGIKLNLPMLFIFLQYPLTPKTKTNIAKNHLDPSQRPWATSHLHSVGPRPSHASFTAPTSCPHLHGNSSSLGTNVIIPGHLSH